MRYYLLLIILFISSIIYAQSSTSSCINKINGRVINKQNNTYIANAVIYIKDKNGNTKKITTDQKGTFNYQLPCDDNRYVVSAIKMNFTESTKLIFTTKRTNKTHDVILEVYPTKEFVTVLDKTRIIIKSIDFLPNEKRITKEAGLELIKVYKILKKYPYLDLKIGFHTDSRGGKDFMRKLTQERADACASYLVNKGIVSDRITATGYGSSRLINECKKGVKCSNEKHLMNKRSEFIVVKKK